MRMRISMDSIAVNLDDVYNIGNGRDQGPRLIWLNPAFKLYFLASLLQPNKTMLMIIYEVISLYHRRDVLM